MLTFPSRGLLQLLDYLYPLRRRKSRHPSLGMGLEGGREVCVSPVPLGSIFEDDERMWSFSPLYDGCQYEMGDNEMEDIPSHEDERRQPPRERWDGQ